MLGMQKESFPFRYLGTVISDQRLLVRDPNYILDKARNTLAADCLSLAGRTVLVKSVLQALPVHIFLSSWTTQTIIRKLEQLIRAFIWKNGQQHGIHLLAWDAVTPLLIAVGRDVLTSLAPVI